ncbi:MAG: hypothetical protein GY694_09030 [Gammaproteobacteria bacterium]|nr:hypothetical protein [Gammaproteobacteria bacterium]
MYNRFIVVVLTELFILCCVDGLSTFMLKMMLPLPTPQEAKATRLDCEEKAHKETKEELEQMKAVCTLSCHSQKLLLLATSSFIFYYSS